MASPVLTLNPKVNSITGQIIGAAMRVHSTLGPGLLESAYEACCLHELRKQGLTVLHQVALPVVYDGVTIDLGYRMDLVVEDLVVVELKCVHAIDRVHEAQILSYLKLSGKPVGLLINFHVAHLRDGIRRFANGGPWRE
ncbi:MAG TPA: GxxExxY protein [Terriglobales bacterium]|nr:GxxExxY protein [Terriglobales bacterium]